MKLCLSNHDTISKYKSERLLWARTAAYALRGPEQLQMLQLQNKIEGRALHHQEKGYLHQATNSHLLFQLQMLHMGQNSCKCFSYKSKIGGRALQKGYLHQTTSELTFALGKNSCKCFTWARTAANASATKARGEAEHCRRDIYTYEFTK